MIIQSMFERKIDRSINGVIKVEQSDEKNLRQELEEYVVTKELRRHFTTFLENYSNAITHPTDKVGVWISGFFGSGKSHFLKMLSYLLENKEVGGRRTIEYFKDKFDDAMLFAQLVRCAGVPTESILFNIDNVSKGEKNDTTIRRVFIQEFFNHLGFYGADLKIAKLEQHIAKKGKMAEFKAEFKVLNGSEWEDARASYAFFEDDVVEVLKKSLGMTEVAARNWFSTDISDLSIKEIVAEIKEYVDSKGKDFRLLFCLDEVGQFIGDNKSLMLNLQTLVEEIGDKCRGKVWIMVTSQEAIDSVIKVIGDDFSKQMARWDTRLSLSSSSADEVIKKRILLKNQDAYRHLRMVYDKEHSVLKNLFTFTNAMSDIKGYGSADDYVATYPFVPYQFIILQKVFTEIRKHGYSIKHLSSGERSMLSGFKDVAEKIMKKGENTLAPFYLFYDTVHTVLDSSIRRVIERAQNAAENGDCLENYDVSVLKLLYLVRYIGDDIRSTIDNISNLMIDDIRTDKIALRQKITESLARLESQNYALRNGDAYLFLTDEEQDIEKDIKGTAVDSASIVRTISDTVFDSIYAAKKISVGRNPFSFDQYIDETAKGTTGAGIRLQFVTMAGDKFNKPSEMIKMFSQTDKAVIVVLSKDVHYYEGLEQAAKIRKYVKQKNVSQLSEPVRRIIQDRIQQATLLEKNAETQIKKAILEGTFYVYGEKLEMKGYADAKAVLDAALVKLVECVYNKLNLVNSPISSDADVMQILSSPPSAFGFFGTGVNNEFALDEISQWLEIQSQIHLPTTMADVQKRYKAAPYGWQEIDIAGLVARLIVLQKIDIRYGGAVVAKDDKRLVAYLRLKSEIDKAVVARRVEPSEQLTRKSIAFLRDWLRIMDIPDDNDRLMAYVIDTLRGLESRYNLFLNEYAHERYPEKEVVEAACALVKDVLSQRADNIALLTRLTDRQDKLRNMTEDMEQIETFFKSQKPIFDAARRMLTDLQDDKDCFIVDTVINEKLNEIYNILAMNKPYGRIKDLTELMQAVRAAHAVLLQQKKDEVLGLINQCMGDVHTLAGHGGKAENAVTTSDNEFTEFKKRVAAATSLTVLDAMITRLLNYKDSICRSIEGMLRANDEGSGIGSGADKQLKIAQVRRYDVFPVKRIENKDDVDTYVESLRKKLLELLDNNDGIQIN